MAAHVTTQRVLIRITACILGPKYRRTCLQSSLGIVDGIGYKVKEGIGQTVGRNSPNIIRLLPLDIATIGIMILS